MLGTFQFCLLNNKWNIKKTFFALFLSSISFIAPSVRQYVLHKYPDQTSSSNIQRTRYKIKPLSLSVIFLLMLQPQLMRSILKYFQKALKKKVRCKCWMFIPVFWCPTWSHVFLIPAGIRVKSWRYRCMAVQHGRLFTSGSALNIKVYN